MRLKSLRTCVAIFCLLAFIQAIAAAPPPDRCMYPPGLRDEISKKYPGTHLVTLADLTAVVWRQGPGKYDGMYEEEGEPIRAKNPVIVLCWYGSSAILYAWTAP